jgi:nucleoside-diphosphate-sugar epimerase
MSTRNRVTFTVMGHHRFLYLIRNLFVQKGFALVSPTDHPDFCLLGVERPQEDTLPFQKLLDIPMFVLSTSGVYAGAVPDVSITHKIPLDEGLPLVLSAYPKVSSSDSLYSLFLENEALIRSPTSMILRVFDIYGSGVQSGVVPSLIDEATKQGTVSVPYPGYQVSSFLYMDDFLQYVTLLCDKFLHGAFGVYNVGSGEGTSLNNLAESVWQFTHGKRSNCTVSYTRDSNSFPWFAVPDTTRLLALTGYTPIVSLRKGIWETIRNKESNLVVEG